MTLPPDVMITPSRTDFCARLAELEDTFVELAASGGADETEVPLIAKLTTGVLDLTGLLDADADRSTIAFLRALHVLFTNGFSDEEAADVAFLSILNLDLDIIANDLRTLCPDVSDPGPWLVDLFRGPPEVTTTTVEVSDGISSADGSYSSTNTTTEDGTVRTTRERVAIVDESVAVGSVNVSVRDVFFERTHIDGTARDTDEIFLDVEFSFDRGHEFTPADFGLTAPDGTVFDADAEQTVAAR